MNMRQVWGLAGGFFVVYILITVTNRPTVKPRTDDAPAAAGASVAPEDAAASAAPANRAPDDRLRGFTLVPADGKQPGATLATTMADIARQGAGWVALQPPIAQPTGASAEVPADPAASLVLEDAREGAKAAKAAGLKVMLRPLLLAGDGTARDKLAPADPEAWVASYGKALQPYLAMAEAEQVELVCVGSRLTTVQGAGAWKKVIEEARGAYRGRLTYAAAPDAEAGFKQVAFWPMLDYVGVDAYFPLSDSADPQARHLEAGWSAAMDAVEAWRAGGGSDKPVLFTSAGVPGLKGGAADPAHPDMRAPEDEKLQAAAYDAFFKVAWSKPWLVGVFWHTWKGGADLHDPYAIVGRPALDVVRTNFGAGTTP